MISIATFYPRVLPYVLGCSEPLADIHIRDAAIYFCQQTDVTRRPIDQFSTVAGLNSYEIDAPDRQLRVERILSLKLDGCELDGVFTEDSYQITDTTGRPSRFYTRRVDELLTLMFDRTPDNAYPVDMSVCFAPTQSASQVEDDLFNLWGEIIAFEAVSRLAMIPETSFSNPGLAMQMRADARRLMHGARIEGYHGRVRGSSTVRPRPLVRSRSSWR